MPKFLFFQSLVTMKVFQSIGQSIIHSFIHLPLMRTFKHYFFYILINWSWHKPLVYKRHSNPNSMTRDKSHPKKSEKHQNNNNFSFDRSSMKWEESINKLFLSLFFLSMTPNIKSPTQFPTTWGQGWSFNIMVIRWNGQTMELLASRWCHWNI